MVTGAVALMRSIKPELTVGQIIKILQRTGRTTDQFIPPMILIDKALEAVKTGRIPPGDNVGQDTPKDANSGTVGEGGRPTDDYAALKEMLDKLKSQRDELNRKISEIEKKIK